LASAEAAGSTFLVASFPDSRVIPRHRTAPTGPEALSMTKSSSPSDPADRVAADAAEHSPAVWLARAYDELRALAARYLGAERGEHTLQPTALVHEAWVRLSAGKNQQFVDRTHFFAVAATAMRRILVDHARARAADRRRHVQASVSITSAGLEAEAVDVEVLELDDLLAQLARFDARKARMVELRFFGGLSNEQIATVLGVARSTVAEDWVVARAWLAARLGGERS
jgi:RNA polymerase sigma-70 factor (ECF subfamily)